MPDNPDGVRIRPKAKPIFACYIPHERSPICLPASNLLSKNGKKPLLASAAMATCGSCLIPEVKSEVFSYAKTPPFSRSLDQRQREVGLQSS